MIGGFPFFKKATLEALETIFATKALGRQLALVSIELIIILCTICRQKNDCLGHEVGKNV